jgi:hypothetical protein
MKNHAAIIGSPMLCLALLAGIALQQRARLRADDAVVVSYHQRAKDAIDNIPLMVAGPGGTWTSIDHKASPAAVRLLRPNVILSRHYVQNTTTGRPLHADLLVVQCRDSRDMTGHYPPICYPNIGNALVYRARHEAIDVGGEKVPFTEYHFEKYSGGRPERKCVYNFFVVPGRGAVDDIKGVQEAAEDYQRRLFGAAQFQVVMPVDVLTSPATREQVFAALVRSRPELIATLKTDGLKP